MKLTTTIKTIALISLLVLPLTAAAQINNTNPSNFATQIFGCTTGVMCIVRNVLLVLLAVAFIIALVFLVIGGFRYIVSQGNEEGVEKAKGTIVNAIIGIVVILLAWIVLTVVMNLITTGSAGA